MINNGELIATSRGRAAADRAASLLSSAKFCARMSPFVGDATSEGGSPGSFFAVLWALAGDELRLAGVRTSRDRPI